MYVPSFFLFLKEIRACLARGRSVQSHETEIRLIGGWDPGSSTPKNRVHTADHESAGLRIDVAGTTGIQGTAKRVREYGKGVLGTLDVEEDATRCAFSLDALVYSDLNVAVCLCTIVF